MADVISFKDAVIELQRLNATSKQQERIAEENKTIQRMIVAVDAAGNKKLIEEEHKVSEEILEETKEQSDQHKETIKSLEGIKGVLLKISKSIETAIAGNKIAVAGTPIGVQQGTELTEDQAEAAKNQDDANKEEHSLLNKMIAGISGLKDATDKGLSNVVKATTEGAKNKNGVFDTIKGSLSSLGEFFKTGKVREANTGRVRGENGKFMKEADVAKSGIGGKWSAAKEAFQAGKAAEGGGIGRGLGRAFSSVAPESAGMVGRGMSAMSGAGMLAGGAALGLAGLNVVNDVWGNMDKSEQIEKSVAQGGMTRSEGNVLQGESLGDTAGTTAGALIGGIAGSALGPVGTAAGAWLGSKAGGFIGGTVGKYGVKAYQGIKSALGFGETKEQEQAKMTPEQKLMNQFTSGEITSDEYNKRMKLQSQGGAAPAPETPVSAQATPPSDIGKVGQGPSQINPPSPVSNIVAVPTQEAGTPLVSSDSFGGGIKKGIGETKLGDTIVPAAATPSSITPVVTEQKTVGKTWFSNLMAPKSDAPETLMQVSGPGNLPKTGLIPTGGAEISPSVSPVGNQSGDVIYGKSVAAEDAKENASKPAGGNAVVNAPTVVNNTTNSTSTMRSPFKNEEASVNRYLRTRYGAY